MKQTIVKFHKLAALLSIVILTVITVLFASPVLAQTGNGTSEDGDNGNFELFKDQLPAGARWTGGKDLVREGGPDSSISYIYLNPSTSPAEMTGLSLPIRENPGPDEYRYVTFRWIKWGGDHIGMRFGHRISGESGNRAGEKYDYTYVAGTGDTLKNALKISDNEPGGWTTVTRDLWKDFGDFTLTGVTFICPDRRDAGFDAIILGQSPGAFEGAPGVLPSQVADPVAIDGEADMSLSEASSTEGGQSPGIQVDWAAQIRAGGVWMYPLYLLAVVAIVIAVQRMMTSREKRLAPRELRSAVRDSLSRGAINAAIEACNQYPSTLGESLSFIFRHRSAGREVVSQTAGDIAARDIREHLNRIYPLSVIASLSPLLGLLGTIVGMIEAFGIVAMYGDQGGAAILSDSISKALITTAAGLIIAVPSIAVYFVIRKRMTRLASVIEVEVENAITELYLDSSSPAWAASQTKEEENSHAYSS